ncbi:putative apurinic/apyrimidinic endonuclease [Trypanosoma cruzi]|uniref:Apurinic/apyrimidinic endonuclease, putative n=2 Tax=Trypanosoma cruzi TaxID=5693 RepID=Q4DNE9_TRYCC|nr:apurinic/apyrimidinic endonuclease, putative [Trypanosoma cruzi]EAN94040.1 apurinic/apyrimidinic endonuclease, putative [Trypanosoma cruzi]PWV06872.1 putative apurinic/apyrimidinic endonuclease [Trypanosoma cruzi]|eukprot:XP_815891.1 apurinic/apyrimidinic endonuclease [Trypanosoma cruzi strain CL Brener]
MFIISWNVAGWSSTSRMIREDFGSIASFLQRTQADIVCLQEVKGSWAKLEADPCGMGASDGGRTLAIDGWESFWSFSGKAHRGFNGVVSFVRKDLTWWCDSRPFSEEDLNDEGRVIVTCHSAFVVVNTYVVNARHGQRMAFKMRFLSSLKNLLTRLKKQTGKPVILLGDLNQTYRAEDACWSLRRLSLPALRNLVHVCQAGGEEAEKTWAQQFPWLPMPTLQRLQGIITEQVSCMLLAGDDNEDVVDSNKSISVDSAVLDETRNDTEDGKNGNTGAHKSLTLLKQLIRERREQRRRNGGSDPLATLEELCRAGLQDVPVESFMRRQPSTHNRELFALTQYCGLPPHEDVGVQFMKRLLDELHLCDTLLVTSSSAENKAQRQEGGEASMRVVCPYTCWDQSRNRRQRNEGTRIDYILIDEMLLPALVPCGMTENNVGVFSPMMGEANSLFAAKKEASSAFFDEFDGRSALVGARRAMADGMYPAAPFDGSGLPPLSTEARDVQFRGLPSTGLFVTPPQYSDHSGVCAHFDGISLAPRPGKLEERHRCQYRPPVSLHAFFAKRLRDEEMTIRTEAAVTVPKTPMGEKGKRPHLPKVVEKQKEDNPAIEITDVIS